MINAINDIMFPILLFLLIYSFLWEFVPDLPVADASEPTDFTSALKEAFSASRGRGSSSDPAPFPEPEPVVISTEPAVKAIPEPVALTPEPAVEAIPEPIAPETESEWLSPASESLPSTIRALRHYIREYNLQEVIKQRTGKTVSQCVKEELIAALV